MQITAKYIDALFRPITKNDRATIEAILQSSVGVLPAEAVKKLADYILDPRGVRLWAFSLRSLFLADTFPTISQDALVRLSEARVAAVYGLRDEAMEVCRARLNMVEERFAQFEKALTVYARELAEATSAAPPPAPHESAAPEADAPR